MAKMLQMDFYITDTITEQDEKEIRQGLLEYNLSRIEDKHPKDLGVFLKDTSGCKSAGLTGFTHGNWLVVKYLWVSEGLRGQDIGSKILKKAEETAKARGCKYAFLDTFSFQAPGFYRKNEYKEVFALEEYPLTGKRHYLVKVF